jgi:hypothetical protein
MKTRSLFLLLALAFILPDISNGQAWVLRRALNKKIDQKVDSALEKSAEDNAKEKEKNNQDKSTSQEKGGTKNSGLGLFGGNGDIKHNDEYNFTGRIYMESESYEKKDAEKADFFIYFSEKTKNAGIEFKPVDPKDKEKSKPAVFLFDNDNRCCIILVEDADSKSGIIATLPSDSAIAATAKNLKGSRKEESTPEQAKKPQGTLTKTGNSRVIAGYKCDEYKLEEAGKEGYSNLWMTKDVKLKADKKYWNTAGIPTYYNYPEFEGGMMLAMESFDKNDKPVMKMETKEINDNFKHDISTTGYSFIKINFGQFGKK